MPGGESGPSLVFEIREQMMQILIWGFLIAVAIVSVGLLGLYYLVEKEQKRNVKYNTLIQKAKDESDEEEVERLRRKWLYGKRV